MALTKVSSGLTSADASSVDLNIDAGTLYIDATNNRVGIGTSVPAAYLGFDAGAYQNGTEDSSSIRWNDVGTADSILQGYVIGTDGANLFLAANSYIDSGGGISAFDTAKKSSYISVSSYIGGLAFGSAASGNPSERMRIDSSGNVGIGVTSPAAKLNTNLAPEGSILAYLDGTSNLFQSSANIMVSHSSSAIGTNTAAGLMLINNNSSNNAPSPLIAFSAKSASGSFNHTYAAIHGIKIASGTDANWNAGALVFRTSDSTGAFERMRIDDSGNLMVGITSVVSNATTTIYKSNLDYGLFIRKGDGTTGSTNKYIGFDISGGGTTGGSITNSSAGNAQFTATSDERLKENIKDVTGCLDKVMALKPSSYTLKQNNLDVPYGFIAQNVETVLPEFVSENEEGYKQISDGLTSGYIAVLTKAIQEQQVLIEQLQAEVALLKGE